ncbi:MAG: hypothetical protein HY261_07175 [Chloroflexi bacterium]|nr:hypothetical protein [Chloroflexota bacterium]
MAHLERDEGLYKPDAKKPGLADRIKALVDCGRLTKQIGEWASTANLQAILAVHGEEYGGWWGEEDDSTELLEFVKWLQNYSLIMPKQMKARRESIEAIRKEHGR